MNNTQRIVLLIAFAATMAVMYVNTPKPERVAPTPQAPAASGQPEVAPVNSSTATTQESAKSAPAADKAEPTSASGDSTPPTEERIVVRRGAYEAEFTNRGGALVRYALTGYQRRADEERSLTLLDEIVPGSTSLSNGVIGKTSLAGRTFAILKRPDAEGRENQLVFETAVDGWRLTKTYTFIATDLENPDPSMTYGFRMDVRIENLTDLPRSLNWTLRALAGFVPDDINDRFGPLEAVCARIGAEGAQVDVERSMVGDIRGDWDDRQNRYVSQTQEYNGAISWLGMHGRYFTTLLKLDDAAATNKISMDFMDLVARYAKGHGEGDPAEYVDYVRTHELEDFVKGKAFSGVLNWQAASGEALQPGASRQTGFLFYGGPKQEEELAFEPTFQELISYAPWSLFEPISRFFAGALYYIHKLIPNYGLCIILLTILIKTGLHGFTRKGLRSSHAMQKVQPQLKAIREKYKNDPQKLNQEMMRLWRENGVSPFGPCVPMLFQLPIFLALYGVFSRVFAMRQQAFIPGWIDDLSQPDALFPLPFEGWDFNLLPLLYAGLQYYQMSMTPKSGDPQQQQMQQTMKIMPVMFMFFFYAMPSGLVLYFTVSAAYTLVEHWLVRKQLGMHEDVQEAPATAQAGQGFKKK